MPTPVVEDYLKTIDAIQSEHNGTRVRTSAVAASLDVTAPTVSSMYTTLAEKGFVDYEKYKGATLTDDGERVARRIRRNCEVLEAYLVAEFGDELSDVHDEIDELEHHISDEFAICLAEKLTEFDLDHDDGLLPGQD